MLKFGWLALALFAPVLGHAAVADEAANGFTIKLQYQIAALPEQVYQKFVHNVGDWWNPMHTFFGDAHNLSIDDKPMGCFCEKASNGRGVRHLEVVFVKPGEILVMTGGLGPLQRLALTGSMSILFKQEGAGTKLEVQYAVTGYLPLGVNTWSIPADLMLTEQFTRFKSYVETGRPEMEKAAPK
jgi:hypothetical protein